MKRKILLIKSLVVIAIVFASFFYIQHKQPNFVIEDRSLIIAENPVRNYSGALLVNLDNDTDAELFVSVLKNKNLFFKRVDSKLIPLKIPQLEDTDHETFSATACDLDSDGRDEILLINAGSNASRIVKFQDSNWVDLLKNDPSLQPKLSQAYSATCIDRRGDGKYGFAVTVNNGPLLFIEYRNEKLTDVAGEIGLNKSSTGRSILGVPGPSGHTNIFVGNSNEANFYFVNDTQGRFTERSLEFGISDPGFEARGASLIDLNNDDLIDLAYGNHAGPLRLLEQTRSGSFRDITPDDLAQHFDVNSIVVEDFNLDGYQDIYLNNVGTTNELFLRTSAGWSEVDLGILAEKEFFGVSSVAADFDKNGSFEILNTHGFGKNQRLTLYSIRPGSNWIRFKLTLPNGGIPRGALLKLKTNKRDQIVAVNFGSGRFANYDDVQAFGLLPGEEVLGIQVTLPSGKIYSKDKDFNVRNINVIRLWDEGKRIGNNPLRFGDR